MQVSFVPKRIFIVVIAKLLLLAIILLIVGIGQPIQSANAAVDLHYLPTIHGRIVPPTRRYQISVHYIVVQTGLLHREENFETDWEGHFVARLPLSSIEEEGAGRGIGSGNKSGYSLRWWMKPMLDTGEETMIKNFAKVTNYVLPSFYVQKRMNPLGNGVDKLLEETERQQPFIVVNYFTENELAKIARLEDRMLAGRMWADRAYGREQLAARNNVEEEAQGREEPKENAAAVATTPDNADALADEPLPAEHHNVSGQKDSDEEKLDKLKGEVEEEEVILPPAIWANSTPEFVLHNQVLNSLSSEEQKQDKKEEATIFGPRIVKWQTPSNRKNATNRMDNNNNNNNKIPMPRRQPLKPHQLRKLAMILLRFNNAPYTQSADGTLLLLNVPATIQMAKAGKFTVKMDGYGQILVEFGAEEKRRTAGGHWQQQREWDVAKLLQGLSAKEQKHLFVDNKEQQH